MKQPKKIVAQYVGNNDRIFVVYTDGTYEEKPVAPPEPAMKQPTKVTLSHGKPKSNPVMVTTKMTTIKQPRTSNQSGGQMYITKVAPPESPSEWENKLRLELDDIFENLEYYDGPNIDEPFTRVFEFTKKFIKKTIKDHDAAIIKAAREMKQTLDEQAMDVLTHIGKYPPGYSRNIRNETIEAVIHIIEEGGK